MHLYSFAMEKRLVLNSWKEIADYMGRGVRTVQRYERDLCLPVHRPAGKRRSAVIGFADEIDDWMRKGPIGVASTDVRKPATTNLEWERLLANSELLLKRVGVLKIQMNELARLLQETEQRHKLLMRQVRPRPFSYSSTAKPKIVRTNMSEISQMATAVGDVGTARLPAIHKTANGQKAASGKH